MVFSDGRDLDYVEADRRLRKIYKDMNRMEERYKSKINRSTIISIVSVTLCAVSAAIMLSYIL